MDVMPIQIKAARSLALILLTGLLLAACGGGPHRTRSRAPSPKSETRAARPTRPTERASQTPGPTYLPEPTVEDPLRILVIGDSLGEDLQDELHDILGSTSNVILFEAAVTSSGLVDPAYYNWPSQLAKDLAKDRPQIVLVLLGGNDSRSFDQNGVDVGFGSKLWMRDYGGRVEAILAEI